MKPFAGKKRFSPSSDSRSQFGLSTGRRLAVLAAIAVIASSTFAFAQAGSLDPTFGTGGVFTTNYTGYDTTTDVAVAIQSDGKIVLGGTIPNGDEAVAALQRLNTNGTLDSSFGSGGIVTSNFGITDGAAVTALAIQPNGQILAAAVGDFLLDGSIGRFNPDGSVDTTFGNSGFAVSRSLTSGAGTLSVMALQTDGEILMTGGGLIGRYTSTGQLDTSFGTNGYAALNSSIATAIALQSDGKILVTTGVGAPAQLSQAPNFPSPGAGAIARYNTNGTLDTTFAISGQAACVASAAGIALQSNGKIVVAGTITSALLTTLNGGVTAASNQTGFGVVRYNSSGSVDTTFNPGAGIGSGGGIITGFGSSFPYGAAFALAIQSNGEIVVAGEAGNGNPQGTSLTSSSFALARYTTNGQLDTSFGTNGTVITTLSQAPISFVSALVLQSDGKIVAAGNTGALVQRGFYENNFAVARYLAQ
ncbi:MAG: hypothetical protein ABSD98_09480 [Candidatus Korobacteraceae bacterium]|jgi:uncharacterized delta-60 repeat protein